jgi:cell division septum initiation protein DivIVA
MEVVDTTQINSFAPIVAQTDFAVSPSEEAVFILNSDQLQDIITKAIEKALHPLQDDIRDLKATVARLDEKIATLEATQDTHADNQLIQLRLINDLREATKKEPQPMQRDRGEILRALIAANGGKMLAKDARQKLRMDKGNFSRLLDTLKDHIDIKPLNSDKRKLLLIIKNRELVVHN